MAAHADSKKNSLRRLFALAPAITLLLLAGTGLLMPQRPALIWYTPQEPTAKILFIEITCRANGEGRVKLYLNLTKGISEIDTIEWSVRPTVNPLTYTFPLPDAPLVELRLDPPGDGVSLEIQSMRIVDGSGEEIRRFTPDSFGNGNQIESLNYSIDRWTITSLPHATDPHLNVLLPAPILAEGAHERNFRLCLYSTGYLALMLGLFLTALSFPFVRPLNRPKIGRLFAYIASAAVAFSFVGNRGLILNTWHYAHFQAPLIPDEIRIELDLASSAPTGAQLFWDDGAGFNESDSQMIMLASHRGLQTARFRLPTEEIRALRFDPRHNGGDIVVRGIRVVDWGNRTHAVLPLDSLLPQQHIDEISAGPDTLLITTTPGEDDPITRFRPEAVEAINAAIDGRLTRFAH